MRFDGTVNFAVLLTALSFLVVAVAGYFRLAVGTLLAQHGAEMKKSIGEENARTALQVSKHEAEDNHRFEKITDSLASIQGGVAGAIVAGQQIAAMQARLEGFDRRLEGHAAQTDARFSEDRKLNHDRYGEIGTMIGRMEVRAAKEEIALEDLRRILLDQRGPGAAASGA